MFSFEFLSVLLAGSMLFGFEQVQVGPPIVGKPFFDPNAVFFEQGFEALKGLMAAAAKDESDDFAAIEIFDPPKPTLISFSAHKRPLFICFKPQNEFFARFDTTWVDGRYGRRFFLIVLITVFILTFKTRAVSRMPEPFMAIVKICSLMPAL